MLLAGLAMAADGAIDRSQFPVGLAFALYFGMLGIGFAPRLLGALDVALRPGEAARYGGLGRLIAGAIADMIFSLMLGPIMMIAQAIFVIGLLFGQRVIWEAQNRQSRSVTLREALRGLWPQLLFGLGAAAVLIRFAPGVAPVAAPTILPCLLAIPFTCLSASPAAGRIFVRLGLCAIPDEAALAVEEESDGVVMEAAI
jgi:membrane glycosyltransferase